MRDQLSTKRLHDAGLAALCVVLGALVLAPAGADEVPAPAPAAAAEASPAPSPPPAAAESPTPAPPPAAPAYSSKGADTCFKCHDDAALLGLFRTAHGRPTDPRPPFGHGPLQCEACHGPGDAHARGKGKNRPALIRFGQKSGTPVPPQNEQCLACHRGTNAH